MEPDQFKLVFNAVCFGASVTAAGISGLFCFLVTKDAWEEKKEEKEKRARAIGESGRGRPRRPHGFEVLGSPATVYREHPS